MKYFVPAVFDHDAQAWFDHYGFTTRQEAQEEIDGLRADGTRKKDIKLLITDGTSRDLISQLATLNQKESI